LSTDANETRAKIDALLAQAGISYHAAFVPFSRSRHAVPSPKFGDLRASWRITFTRAGRAHATDYSQGIGHLPNYEQSRRPTLDYAEVIRQSCETGTWRKPGGFHVRPLPAPRAADVLQCLILDMEVIEHASFEEWARDMGENPDSRAAEAIYRACLTTALALRPILGETLEPLRTILADY
jgi:hypothetical protein